ncbi:MAG: efflux RND transporter periplasmic adaptor subunit [Myxococcales bacterium]|nr:efflux RND transporter periplasmic adaptor subunit [Myxococcales bacterium]MCB9736523.1 efflux RND transporter periplasmic adaptor subunit [Deltaproteobacteria bacterium]
MKRVIPIFILLVAGLATVLYLELRAQEREAERPSRGSGTIEGVEVDAVARLPARIVAIPVDEGDHVERGALLVELDCREAEAALAQADAAVATAKDAVAGAKVGVSLAESGITAAAAQSEAALAAATASRTQRGAVAVQRSAAERAAKRVGELAATGGASEQDLDRARTEAAALSRQLQAVGASATATEKQAEAVGAGETAAALKLEAAKAQLTAAEHQVETAEAAQTRARLGVEECRIVAPRAGIVTARNFEPGEVVLPGSRVVTVVDIGEVKATFYLPNAELAAAKPGRPVEVVADAIPGKTFAGVIRRVGAEAEFTPRNVQTRDDRDRLVYAVEVAVPNPEEALRPGMPVEIAIPGTGRGE